MESTSPAARGKPPASWLIPFSIPCMAISLFAWGAVAMFEAMGGYNPDPEILVFVPLLPLPAALVGAIAAWRSGRWWPWYMGVVLTLLPAVLAIVLAEQFDPGLGNRKWGE